MTQPSASFSTQDLVAFALGETDESLSTQIAAAAKNDIALGQQLSRIQTMVQSLHAGVLEPAPAALKKAAVELFQSLRPLTLSDWLAGLAHSTLARVFDSRETPQLAGFRGQSDSRHITFADQGTEVDLLVEEDGDTRMVRGQVTGLDGASVAAIARSGAVLETASIDKDGAFVLGMNSNAYDLSIRGGDRAVIIENALLQ